MNATVNAAVKGIERLDILGAATICRVAGDRRQRSQQEGRHAIAASHPERCS
jgi:hypothetical protein